MGFLGSGHHGHPMMNLVNFGLRVCQFLLAIVTLGLYAHEIRLEEDRFNKIYGIPAYYAKTVTAIVVSCLSLVTAAAFAILPFITADYFHVAVCFPWDFVILCIWSAVFAFTRALSKYYCYDWNYANGSSFDKDLCGRTQATVWVALTCLLLWLATTILGILGVLINRRRGRRATVV